MKKQSLIRAWRNKGAILEGIKNSVFKKEDIEIIARERRGVCEICPYIGKESKDCEFDYPCCTVCSCVLGFKLRVMSEECPKGFWKAELTEEESDALKEKIYSEDGLHEKE